jgi:predicted RNase H-like HicB family nuclease
MKFLVTLEQDEDGMWVAECPALTGCISQGKTRAEALANIQAAIRLTLEVRTELNMPGPLEVHEVDVAA